MIARVQLDLALALHRKKSINKLSVLLLLLCAQPSQVRHML